MAFIAISEQRWKQLTKAQDEARLFVWAHLLNTPDAPLYADGVRRWYVSADDRIRPEDAKMLSLLTKNRAAINANWKPKKVKDSEGNELEEVDRAATAADIAERVRDAVEVPIPPLAEDEDPFGRWDHVHFRAFTSMPDGWVAVSDE